MKSAAFSTAPWTLPAHASLFTGRWPHELTADYGIRLDDAYPTLAEKLASLGYHAAGFTANRPNTASATGLARGFARYDDYPIGWGPLLGKSFLSRLFVRYLPIDKSGWRMGRKSATQNTDDVLRWLDRDIDRDTNRPMFLFVNYFDAHDPYSAPQSYRARFTSDVPPILKRQPGVSEADMAGTRALYHAAISYVDNEVDRLLREMDRRSMLSNAVVIIASDHGEAMGEHGLQFHGNHLYTPILRVPLVVIAPGRAPAGVTVHRAVSIRDVGATIFDLGDYRGGSFPGLSLARFWSDEFVEEGSQTLIAQMSPSWQTPWREGILRSVVAGDFQYFVYPDGKEELYDLEHDPDQVDDLASNRSSQGHITEFRVRLDSILADRDDKVAAPE